MAKKNCICVIYVGLNARIYHGFMVCLEYDLSRQKLYKFVEKKYTEI